MQVKRESKISSPLLFLALLNLTLTICTSLFAYKFSNYENLIISNGIFIFPITYIIYDVIAECYGYYTARKILFSVITCQMIFAVIVNIIVRIPSTHSNLQHDYEVVLLPTLWFCFSNIIGVLIGSYLNLHLISKWKMLTNGRYFIFRSIGSSIIGESITSIIADLMAFIGIVDFSSVINIMLTIWLIKIIYSVILSYPAAITVFFLKKYDNSNMNNLIMNPFQKKAVT